MSLAQNLIIGTVTGSYIAIAAIGFTLMYGIINMINFAYGEYMTLGAYLGFVGATMANLPLPVAVPLVMGIAAVAGLVLGRAFFRPIQNAGPVPLLLTSVGVGLILRNGYRLVAGSSLRFFEYTASTNYQFDVLGGFYISTQHLFIIGIAVAVFVLIHILLTRTKTGVAMRATSNNEDLARITGIQTDRVRDVTWLIASALAGLAGYLIAVQRAVSPVVGFDQLLIVLTAAILGGAGSAYGAILGAYVIGIIVSLTVGIFPPWASSLGTTMMFVVLIGVLLLRPNGIAGGEVTT